MISKESFIISDTHWGHKNVLKYEPIRLEISNQHGYGSDVDTLMIDKWNENISEEDTILHLGDLFFKNKESQFELDTLNSLNGNKLLLIGNHDRPKYYNKLDDKWFIIDNIIIDNFSENFNDLRNNLSKKFELSQKEKRLLVCFITTINNKRILFSHFPLFNNNPYDKKYNKITDALEYLYNKYNCDLNIHGHTHSYNSIFENSINVSVENQNLTPIKIKELLK